MKQLAKNTLKRSFGTTLLMLGFDPRKLISIRYLPKYIGDYFRFKKAGGVITNRFPVLNEFSVEAGTAKGHYFHQDLLVASLIHKNNPIRHIDVGSRIDGFVAHVAAYRKIEVIDIRELEPTKHSNITFKSANFMDNSSIEDDIADSVSCLHAIEHFGLGRYGDPIDPKGHIKGFNQLLRVLKEGGLLYISFPICNENRVYFNAHRAFHPKDIFTWAIEDYKIELLRFDFVDDEGNLHKNFPLNEKVPKSSYGCGIYTLIKNSSKKELGVNS